MVSFEESERNEINNEECFDDFVNRVVKEAKRQSKYKSICVDNLRQYYNKNEFENAVRYAIAETAYWEGDI